MRIGMIFATVLFGGFGRVRSYVIGGSNSGSKWSSVRLLHIGKETRMITTKNKNSDDIHTTQHPKEANKNRIYRRGVSLSMSSMGMEKGMPSSPEGGSKRLGNRLLARSKIMSETSTSSKTNQATQVTKSVDTVIPQSSKKMEPKRFVETKKASTTETPQSKSVKPFQIREGAARGRSANRGRGSSNSENDGKDEDPLKNRPFTLPPGLFRPKQSLGQNFLSDQNYVEKIVNALVVDSEEGHRVIEIGPGSGAITRVLHKKYPRMTAIEIDQRAVKFLSEKIPELNCLHLNVLNADWGTLATERCGKLNILGNLPYYITSQVLFTLADHYTAINQAVVTMQLEVAERITAKPKTKDYGIPSVVFQLYGRPVMNFKIPPTVFFPQPKVDSALITIDFSKPHPKLNLIRKDCLRKILTYSFQQRRKMMRVSLKDLMLTDGLVLGEKWATKRPEELSPSDFIELVLELYGPVDMGKDGVTDVMYMSGAPVWRVPIATREGDDGDDEEELLLDMPELPLDDMFE